MLNPQQCAFHASCNGVVASYRECAWVAKNQEDIEFDAPSDSPYSGASFSIRVTPCGDKKVWTWQTKIYHPLFAAGATICQCLLTRCDNSGCKTVSEVMRDILLLLEKPNYCTKCEQCQINDDAFTEMKTDLAFFVRKARAHTPNTNPPSDEELRGGLSLSNFLPLLTTGAFSDIKLVVDKTVFRCHRTVLAARSPVFRSMFENECDGGTLRLNPAVDPRAVARFLQFVYGSVITARDAVDVSTHISLCSLAREYKVTALHHHHVACLARRLNATNKFVILAAASDMGDALLSRAVALAIAALDAAESTETGTQAQGCGPVARRPSSIARRASLAPY
eukprot:m.56934 g.56934  ORF g.56934 m.56934 type:complete len:337 (+) comp12071_c0_seq3:111-1121(+)